MGPGGKKAEMRRQIKRGGVLLKDEKKRFLSLKVWRDRGENKNIDM